MLVGLRVGGKQPESTGLKISGGMQELAFPSIKYQMFLLLKWWTFAHKCQKIASINGSIFHAGMCFEV
jgi:hypothetical protein